jgi:hypothetical protein
MKRRIEGKRLNIGDGRKTYPRFDEGTLGHMIP